ncbi:hypothetical protein SAMN02744124_02902, partial [Paenibacillus barengoltzii J12]
MNVFVKPSVLNLPEHVAREQKCERRSARCYPWVGYHMLCLRQGEPLQARNARSVSFKT